MNKCLRIGRYEILLILISSGFTFCQAQSSNWRVKPTSTVITQNTPANPTPANSAPKPASVTSANTAPRSNTALASNNDQANTLPLRTARRFSPLDSLDIYLLKAVEARNQKSYLEATRILEYVVRQYPRSINAKLELATTYAWQKRYEAAIEQYNAVLAQEKQNIAARNGLGRIQSWRNQSEAAITTFQGVLREEPNNLEAMLGMAFTYTLKRNIKQAKYYYESVLNIDPNNTEAKEGLINLYPPKRSDITLSTGVLTVSDGHDVVQHVLEFSQQLRNRNWSVTGAAFRANDTNRFQNGIHLGLMRQLGVGGSFGASVYTSFGDFGKRYSLAFDATKQLSSNLTLLGTVRPGINTDKQFEWIAGGGMLWQMSRDSYALGQYFAENLYGLEPAHTVTATTYLAVLPHFALQPSVFFHANRHDNAHNILNYSLGVHFRWTNKLSLGAHYGLGKNQKQQLGFTLRIRR